MRLLIIGAGSHGKVVSEIAQDCGYDEIAFLDDNNPEAIGSIGTLSQQAGTYPAAFVAIGDNQLRKRILNDVQRYGFIIPTLIHPTAFVSKSSIIGSGTVVEPNATINSNSFVGVGCIISAGAIIDHNAFIEEFCHINAGVVVGSFCHISPCKKLEYMENKNLLENVKSASKY